MAVQKQPLFQSIDVQEFTAVQKRPAVAYKATLRKELHQRFVEAIDRLEDEDREILLMRHFEQLTNSEAAGLLGLSQPAAGMRH